MLSCRDVIMSEDYADFLLPYTGVGGQTDQIEGEVCSQAIDYQYRQAHVLVSQMSRLSAQELGYSAFPKLFGLLDKSSLERSRIFEVQNQPALQLKGEGVLIGFIDTGIDYTLPIFRNADGSSRIVGIWDQTATNGTPPDSLLYGREYSKEEIDRALSSENPHDIVEQEDTSGHGTYLAGIAAGSEDVEADFIGVAPEASIAMVKLKPAKKYLRDYFQIREGAEAFQENDIMIGLRYLEYLARKLEMPLVICIGLGTSQGSHTGVGPLSEMLSSFALAPQHIVIVAGGNEGGTGHHYQGQLARETAYEEVELRVGEEETGFTMELWASAPELYTISIQSPVGERAPRIPSRIGQSQVISYIFDKTKIVIDYQLVDPRSGNFMIQMRFFNPTAGIWRFQVYNSLFISGTYHMWLPISSFITEETYFLSPNPNTTLTIPANADLVLTTSGYDHRTGGLYLNSSRGFTQQGGIKPSLAAPAVNVYGPELGGVYGERTGTSVAAAHMAGASALLMEWAVFGENQPNMNTGEAITFFIRGADRSATMNYPNREWGFGTLNMYQSFERLILF